MKTLSERQVERWKMLRQFYDLADGAGDRAIISLWTVGEVLGWDRDTTTRTFDYLNGEGLLKPVALGGGSTITHYGVKEVESALAGTTTEHFSPNIVVVSGGQVGSIAVGNTGQVTQISQPSGLGAADDLEQRLRGIEHILPREATTLLQHAREESPRRSDLVKATEDTAALGPKWSETLNHFVLQAASAGTGGLLVEAIKFALGI